MTTQVIETKRQPPLWSVKVGHRFRGHFHGVDARAKAEAFATEHHGTFEVVTKPVPAREIARLKAIEGSD